MTHQSASRAADLAASQVETIVSAAQAAADELRRDATREAEEIRAEARRESAQALEAARAKALELVEDARREAEQLRHDSQRAVEERLADAQEASHQVLEDARQLSAGLRRLGEVLGDQAQQILREVHAAHRRMQADLRVDLGVEREQGGRVRRSPRQDAPAQSGPDPSPGGGTGDLDVPSWIGRRPSADGG